jgi:hypothetical protein
MYKAIDFIIMLFLVKGRHGIGATSIFNSSMKYPLARLTSPSGDKCAIISPLMTRTPLYYWLKRI